jgi:hypothetical protein
MEITDFLSALLPAENPRVTEEYGHLLAGGLQAVSPTDQKMVIRHLLMVAGEKGNELVLQTELWPAIQNSAKDFDSRFLLELQQLKKRAARQPNGADLSQEIDGLIQTSWQKSASSKDLPQKMKNIIEFTNKGALLAIIALTILLIGSLWWHWSDTSSAGANQAGLDSLQARIQYDDSNLHARDTVNARLKKELDSLLHKTLQLPAAKDSATTTPHRQTRTRRASEARQ